MYSQEHCSGWRNASGAGLGAVCVLAVTLQAYGADRSTRRWQVRRLQRDIGCLELMTKLGLSAPQKAQLAPIVRKAVAAERDYEQTVADLAPELLEAYGDLKVQAKKNLGFAQDVTERAEDCSRLMKELGRPLKEELRGLEGQIRTILTPKQLALVEDYQPRRSGHLGPGGTGSRKRRPGLGQRRQETGQSASKKAREELTTISTFMLCAVGLPLLDSKVQSSEALPMDEPETQAAIARVQDLETDLRILSMVNALNLTADQMRQLAAVAEQNGGEARDTYETLTAQRDALMQARRELLTRGEIARATYRRLRSAAGDRTPGQPGRRRTGAATQGVKEVEKLLTDAQRRVLAEHKPYVVCPRVTRDPARAGQAQAKPSIFAKFLEEMRRCPPGQEKSRVEKYVKREEAKIGLRTPAERQARIDQIVAIVRKIPAMSDVDFALSKDRLTEEGQLSYSRRGARAGGSDSIRRVIERYLLNERIVPLLKERLDDNP